jgi:hypothetical protein
MSALVRQIAAPLLALVLPGLAPAEQPASPPAAPAPAAATPTTPGQPTRVEFADDPLRLDAVGLTMLVPTNAAVQSTRIGGTTTAQIVDKASRWLINVQTPQATTPESSVTTAADQTIALIQGSVGVTDPSQTKVVSTEAKLLSRNRGELSGQAVEQFYLSVPRGVAGDAGRLVKGYTIFKPTPNQFVVLELVTTESEFPTVRPVFETVAGTATFADMTRVSQSRAAAIQAGTALFARLTPADWNALLDGVERWQRLSRPSATGDASDAEEIGYRGLAFRRGNRGEIDPDRDMATWSAADRDEGYLARVRVRVLEGKDQVIDSEANYFTTPDRTDESWEVRTYVRTRAGKTLGTWRETGGRAGQDVTVQVEQTGQSPRVVKPLIQGEGYLGAVEALLLPRVMIRSAAQSEFAYYTYRTQSENISLRRDRLDKAKTPGGGWVITTTFREGEREQVASYTQAGELIQIDLGDGRVWKPTELDALFNLWKRKGLPVTTEPERDRKRRERQKDRDPGR